MEDDSRLIRAVPGVGLRLRTRLNASAAIFATALMAGCAMGFYGGELPRIDSLPDMSHYARKPSVYLDLNRRLRTHQSAVQKAAAESKLFRDFTFDQRTAEGVDYVIRLTLESREHVNRHDDSAIVYQSFCIATIGVLPCKSDYSFTLSATVVFRKAPRVDTSYELVERLTFVAFGFYSVPGVVMTRSEDEVIENMIRVLFKTLLDEGVLEYS